MSYLFLLAVDHPRALKTDDAAAALAQAYVDGQRTNIGDHYSSRMKVRLLTAFLSGLKGEPRLVQHSNFERPLRTAYWAGREIRALLTMEEERRQ